LKGYLFGVVCGQGAFRVGMLEKLMRRKDKKKKKE
jgi:hypothetical protein